MNRGLRAAAIGALLLAPTALGACSAGQVAQTAEQRRDKVGNLADVGTLSLRALQLPYPTGGVYSSGGDARLLAAVASTAPTDDTLVSIEGEGFDSVEVVDPAAEAETDDAAGGSGSGSDSLDITIPAAGTVYLGDGTGPAVTLVGLADDLGVGEYLDVTFTFEEAGEVSVQVPVAVAARELPRGEAFDFGEGEESGGDVAQEEESNDGG